MIFWKKILFTSLKCFYWTFSFIRRLSYLSIHANISTRLLESRTLFFSQLGQAYKYLKVTLDLTFYAFICTKAVMRICIIGKSIRTVNCQHARIRSYTFFIIVAISAFWLSDFFYNFYFAHKLDLINIFVDIIFFFESNIKCSLLLALIRTMYIKRINYNAFFK